MDICRDILQLTRNGAIKTRIVYGANLNFEIVKGYLSKLLSLGLLEESRKGYRTTEKGLDFIESYEELSRFGLM
ncbi:MAG: winged helix-turn-helix domain-containing protein [Candidatus Bathyarchaeota archaeon]|nr:winged helix-turn-helix domain-containing protein [Candidatus Bathyarchaeota archaeon]